MWTSQSMSGVSVGLIANVYKFQKSVRRRVKLFRISEERPRILHSPSEASVVAHQSRTDHGELSTSSPFTKLCRASGADNTRFLASIPMNAPLKISRTWYRSKGTTLEQINQQQLRTE